MNEFDSVPLFDVLQSSRWSPFQAFEPLSFKLKLFIGVHGWKLIRGDESPKSYLWENGELSVLWKNEIGLG